MPPSMTGWWNRCCGNGFTRLASILWTDVAVNEEFCGLYIKLFGDVFTDLDQIGYHIDHIDKIPVHAGVQCVADDRVMADGPRENAVIGELCF